MPDPKVQTYPISEAQLEALDEIAREAEISRDEALRRLLKHPELLEQVLSQPSGNSGVAAERTAQ